MPPRRKANPSAAKLPLSRLPLGTHLPGSDSDLRPTSRNTDSTSSPPATTWSSEPDTAAHIDIHHHPAYINSQSNHATSTPASDMSASDNSGANQPALSMAEAKLRRQQERIQRAEALAAPHHLDRREPSRDKNKPSWKPMNIEWDTMERAKNDGGIPVHTRTNTLYGPAFSRDTSLSRSLSSISQQTSATDADRHDSLVDNAGFQTYHGRRGRKQTDDLGATEDTKQEERQATVEGSYDKREMRKVFGGELPGIDFISSNCGFNDGQLQFVQHPNGDVSAHMWSLHRYMWENIGNFSNIRKRVEGQLASDRLKGETGWQTLQKNTLAYFRAIAKQREQTTMGYEFGQAEILQILPQPPPEATKPPEPSRPASPATSTSSRQPSNARPPLFNPSQQQSTVAATQRTAQANPQPTRPAPGRGFPFLSNEQASGKDDPFSASGIFLPTKEPPAPATKATPQNNTQPAKLTAPVRLPSNPFLSTNPATKPSSTEAPSRPQLTRPSHDIPPARSGLSGLFPLNTAKLGAMNLGQQAEQRPPSVGSNAGTPSRTKPASGLSSREAMRDQLWKVSEFAQKRTNSQTNIRTVLHDPFQNQSAKSEEARTEPFPDFDLRSERDGSYLYLPPGYRKPVPPSHRTWTDTQPALNGTKPVQLGRQEQPEPLDETYAEETLADSVPDVDIPSGNRVTSYQSSGPTYVTEEQTKPASASKKSYDEELNDWWTGGNRWARQEDLYQRIKALEISKMANRRPGHTTTTPSARLRPIGAPPINHSSPSTASSQNPSPPFNPIVTRMLIPVAENLASYVQGPIGKRRDYWSNWSQPPEWCIDRSANGNNSFFDEGWGQPPARVGRDPRFRPMPGELRFGGFSPGGRLGGSPRGRGMGGMPGVRGGMGFGGHY